jgi:hypothetical protein
MKKFFFLIFFFGIMVLQASAQRMYIFPKVIKQGDSVLVAVIWRGFSTFSTAEMPGLYTPSEKDKKNGGFAFYAYPKATRSFDIAATYSDGSGVKPLTYTSAKKRNDTFGMRYYTIVVVDDNGNEVRDSLSDTPNSEMKLRCFELPLEQKEWNELKKELTPNYPYINPQDGLLKSDDKENKNLKK